MEVKDNNGNVEYHIGRKGLMKFFDMRLSFISKDGRSKPDWSDERSV